MKKDFKELMIAINQVCHERQLPIDIVLEAVEVALVSAYKRNFSGNHSITAQIDPKTGKVSVFTEKMVVETVQDERNEISLEQAKAINPPAKEGELISVDSTPDDDFGRIAAQTAKQVILQRIREAERDALFNTYAEREGEIVNGTVHKIDPHQVIYHAANRSPLSGTARANVCGPMFLRWLKPVAAPKLSCRARIAICCVACWK
ncbi:MAG: hypothetical protein HYR94_11955 [Chloroflexi bacterium]|nr:hypothetical protein [Chloroflexota bacterium]